VRVDKATATTAAATLRLAYRPLSSSPITITITTDTDTYTYTLTLHTIQPLLVPVDEAMATAAAAAAG